MATSDEYLVLTAADRLVIARDTLRVLETQKYRSQVDPISNPEQGATALDGTPVSLDERLADARKAFEAAAKEAAKES